MEPPKNIHRLSTSLSSRGMGYRTSTSMDSRSVGHRLSTSVDSRGRPHKSAMDYSGHGLQVQPLFTAPALQKSGLSSGLAPERSTLTIPELMPNKLSDTSVDKLLYGVGATSVKDKVKKKETTGHKLLSMLKQTLRGTETEEHEEVDEVPTLVPFGDVVGCLAVHIKNCRHFSNKIIAQHFVNLYIRIIVHNIVKSTRTHNLLTANHDKSTKIRFNEVKYFSVQVPRRQDDERNNISLQLMQYDTTEKNSVSLGSAEVHLYEVIQKGYFTEDLQMLNKNTFACRLEAEFMFSYGNFGYGFSHQLKPLQKIIEPSMFMNVKPPPDRKDPVTNVITPQPIEYPAFLSPDLNVTVGNPATPHHSNHPSVVRLEKLAQEPSERLEKMKKEYRNLGTWMEKADYLENLLNPQLEPKVSEEYILGEFTEDQTHDLYEYKTESETLANIPSKISAYEVPSSELPAKDNEEEPTTPTLSPSNQDYLMATASKSDESAPTDAAPTDAPVTSRPSMEIPEGDTITPLYEKESKTHPEEKMKSRLFPAEVAMDDKYRSILKSNSPEVKTSTIIDSRYDYPYLPDVFPSGKFYRFKNTNKKGKTVAFSPKNYSSPYFRPEYIEFKPTYQRFNKAGFEPFLRNINNTMSTRKRKDQEIYKCRNILSAEAIEHEDQDPPYPSRSKTTGFSNISWAPNTTISTPKTWDTKNKSARDPTLSTPKTWDTKNKSARDPLINTPKTWDTKNKSSRDHTTNTTKALDTNNKLKERLPNVSLPTFRELSVTGNKNASHPSKSLNFTPHIENLKQSMVLKSILSKNLQDLSDKLFSINPEAIHKSGPPFLIIHDRPASTMDDKLSEKIQDLNGLISEKDISDSKAILSQIIKNITSDILLEGKLGKAPEGEDVFEKHPQADNIDFPMKKKSSVKKKHVISEVATSKSGLKGNIHDYIIKQIFTAPIFSQLEKDIKELSMSQLNFQNQLPAPKEGNVSSNILVDYRKKDEKMELQRPKSVISQIIQAFPVDTLLESGIIKVMELDKEYQTSSLLNTKPAFSEEARDATEDYSEIKSKTQYLSRQATPTVTKKVTTSIGRVGFIEDGQSMSQQDPSSNSTADEKRGSPSKDQLLDGEENDLTSSLESLNNSLMSKLNESDSVLLKSFFKNIFKVFFKYHQPERREKSEKELERLIQYSFPSDIKHFEEIQRDFNKIDTLDRKPVLSPKLRVFLEELSESEVKNLKLELSKHIQRYLVERLSESGHITKEDLPKIYQNLYLMNEKVELKGQNVFQEKYSETVKEIMSFVTKFNHHFIDKHLEIKLRSFLNEILQNYFLKNLSESLFSETASTSIYSNISTLRTRSAPISLHELRQDISRGSFGRRLEINMKYPLNKSLQNFLKALSEHELLNLKADLSKHLQRLFLEKLSKLGLMSERQLKGISQHISLLNSSSIPLRYIKTDLPFRDENHFLREHLENQNHYSKTDQNTSPTFSEDKHTEMVSKKEKEYFSLYNSKENPSTTTEQNDYYAREGGKTLSIIKIQPPNKNIQVIPLDKPPETLTDVLLKKHKKEHGFMPLPRAENSAFKTDILDPYSWDGKSTTIPPKACFDRTLKVKPLDKKENINICKLTGQENPDIVWSPCPRIPNCKMPREYEEYLNRVILPSQQANTSTHFNLESEEQSKLDQYCRRLKGHNNNNKKHSVTFAQYKKEMQTPYINPSVIHIERCVKVPESQLFNYEECEKNSKPPFFPEVLTRQYIKNKVRKEKDHASKPKKSFNKIVRILPTTLPSTRNHLRKSVPRTLLHWTARRTIHDCSDRFEDLHVAPVQHLKKTKSRARLLGKIPDDGHCQVKHSTRPYTAPGPNKRRESHTGKLASPRMISSGLIKINDTTLNYDMRKMRPKKKLKEDIEKCSLICDIIQMLNSSK